jgi:hypothetical protein
MTEETYNSEVKCKNCKKINYILKIPKRTLIEKFLEENQINCSNCECSLYKEKEEKE